MRFVTQASAFVCAVFLVSVASGCMTSATSPSAEAEGFVLSSPDLDAEGYLDDWAIGDVGSYCDGENRSPVLEWTGSPADTQGFVISLTDPAHPSYIHWVVTGIPANTESLAGAEQGRVSEGTVGRSSLGAGAYAGPCLAENTYVYTVYALDELISGDESTTLENALELMDSHILDSAELEVAHR